MALPKLLYGETHSESLQLLAVVSPTPRGVAPDDRFEGEVEELREEGFKGMSLVSRRSAQFMATVKSLGQSGPGDADGKFLYKKDPSRTKWEEAAIYIQEGRYNDKFINHPRGKWSRRAYLISHHPIYYITELTASILLMLLAIIEEPAVISIKDHHNVHISLELLFLAILGFDIVLRFIWFGPKNCIKHKRTMFGAFLLVVLFCEAITIYARQSVHFRITRALRPFFLIHTYPAIGVRRVLRMILFSMKPIIDVLLILFFMVTVFALIGYYLFAEVSFTYFSTFAQSFVSLFITLTTANNPDVMAESYSKHFVSSLFFITYLIITVYFSTNILLAVVYSEFSSRNRKKFKELFLHEREALLYAYLVLAGPRGISFEDFVKLMQIYKPWKPEWQVMCIFKAMQRNPDEQSGYLTLEEFYGFYEVGNYKWVKDDDRLWWHKLPDKMKQPFHYIDKLVTWNGFNMIVVIGITVYNLFLVICALTIPSSKAHARYDQFQLVISVSFIVVIMYCAEITLRIISIGPIYYYRSFWNVVDSAIVLVSLLCLCLETNSTYNYFLAVRPIIMTRYLMQRRRYRNILNTLVLIRTRLISVGLLILVVFYFFAIIGMESSGPSVKGDLIVFKGCCNTSWFGVGQFYQGPITVPANESVATNFSSNVFSNSSHMNIGTTNVYYLYNFDNILYSYVTLFILMIVNNWFIIMEGVASEVHVPWLARFYFMAFYVITLIILQVIISFIVEAFVLRIKYIDNEGECKVHKKHHRCPHTENEGYKKRKEVRFVEEDVQKLRYQITYFAERKQSWTLFRIIRCLRQIDLEQLESSAQTIFKGHRKQTKNDINLLLYKDELPTWLEGHEPILCRSGSASTPEPSLWKKFLKKSTNFIIYFFE